MKNVPENELFSAYLDGELTAGEQAQVERLLATSPAARQLMDELRALSATLQAMPTYTLEEDLTPHVLRTAERRMLGQKEPEAEPPREAAPAPEDVEPVPSPWKGIGRRLLTPRNLVWSATAVAVAVMFTIFEPGRDRPAGPRREVALGLADRETREAPAGATMQAPREEEAKDQPVKEALPKKEPAPPSAPSAAPAVEKPQSTSPPPAPVAGKGAGGGYAYQGVDDSRGGPGKRGPRPEGAQGKSGGGFGATAAESGTVQTVQSRASMDGQSGAADRRRAQPWQRATGTTVVFCDVSPQAARSRAFDRLLSRQQIVLEGSSREAGELPGDLAEEVAKKLAKKLVEKLTENRPAEKGVTGRKGHGFATQSHVVGKPRDDARKHEAVKASGGRTPAELDLVLVQATPAQIEATLDALNAQPQDFVTVDVRPAPSRAEQQGWTRYTRGSFDEQAERQLNGVLKGGEGEGKSDAGSLDDGTRSARGKQKPLERKRPERQRRAGGQFGRAQHVELPVDGVQFRAAQAPALPEKPAVRQPALQPAGPPERPLEEVPADDRDNRPVAAPARKPSAPQPEPPAEPAGEKPGAAQAPADPFQAPAEGPPAPPAEAMKTVPERPGALKGPDLKQAPATAPQPPPRPKVEKKPAAGRDAPARKAGQTMADKAEPTLQQDITPPGQKATFAKKKAAEPKRRGEGRKARTEEAPWAEQEESNDADKEAAPCQVLFVLRVVDLGDVTAAASAGARPANVTSLKKVQPRAAETDAARQAAPAGKR